MTMRGLVSALTLLSLFAWRGYAAGKFDLSRSDNIAVYWGQLKSPLADLCKNDDVNIIPIGFMVNVTGPGAINLAGNCDPSVNATFAGTALLDCHGLAQDIKACQSAGKMVTLSIGGATGIISFSSEDEAKAFGETFYNNFLGGKSSTRPFADAILDGMDLDIEASGAHIATFVNHTLEYAKQQNDDKKYYVTGAPQCPCPDENMKEIMSSAPFDAVFVQFYNNPPCQLTQDVNLDTFNFGEWVDWFQQNATYKDTKIYVGAPGSRPAAGSGYVDSATLGKYIDVIRKNSTAPSFGGMMFWDAGSIASNSDDPNFLHNVKKALTAGGAVSPSGSSSDAAPSATSESASASAPGASTTDASSATDSLASGTSGAASATEDSTAISATGTASNPTSTALDGSSVAGTGTSQTADGPVATTSGADSQTTAHTSSPTGSSGDDGDSDSDDSDCEDDGDESSQAAGPTATPTSSVPASATCTPPPSDCAGVPEWQKTQQYQKCANVQYKGQLYQASSWVTSNEPGTIDVWNLVGSCPGSSAGTSLDSSTLSSSGSLTAPSTASSIQPSSGSSTAPIESVSASSSAPSVGSSAASATGLTSSATGAAAGGTTASSVESQDAASTSQPERRLFGARARHAE